MYVSKKFITCKILENQTKSLPVQLTEKSKAPFNFSASYVAKDHDKLRIDDKGAYVLTLLNNLKIDKVSAWDMMQEIWLRKF